MDFTGFIPVVGGSLYCESSGEGEALVMIHGFSLDCRMWDYQFPVLSRHFRAIRYDVRGFGRSSLPAAGYDHSSDLSQLLNALGVSRAVIVGLSMGGAIAINFVISHPGNVAALVLVDSSIGYMQPSREAASYGKSSATRDEQEYIGSVKRLWLDDELFKPAFRSEELKERIAAMVNDYSGYHWIHENPVARITADYMLKIRHINVPTLIVVGEKDIPKHQRIADLLSGSIKGAQKTVIPDAGHMSSMEQPDLFNDVLIHFLS